MFKRHPTFKMAIIAYLTWWILVILNFLAGAIYKKLDLFIGLTLVIFFTYLIVLIIKIAKNKGVSRRDFSIMLVLVLLPVLLPILAFWIYLICGGRIISKLW